MPLASPYNPQGQTIVERTHRTHKDILAKSALPKAKQGRHLALTEALFTWIFLSLMNQDSALLINTGHTILCHTAASRKMEGPYHPLVITSRSDVDLWGEDMLVFSHRAQQYPYGSLPEMCSWPLRYTNGMRNLLFHSPSRIDDVCLSSIPDYPCFATIGGFACRRSRTCPWHDLAGVWPSFQVDLPNPSLVGLKKKKANIS